MRVDELNHFFYWKIDSWLWAFIEGDVGGRGGVRPRVRGGCGARREPRCFTRPRDAAAAARHGHIVLSQQYDLTTAAPGQAGRGDALSSLEDYSELEDTLVWITCIIYLVLTFYFRVSRNSGFEDHIFVRWCFNQSVSWQFSCASVKCCY